MKVSALHPPNCRRLSDSVITGVVQQRLKASRHVHVAGACAMNIKTMPLAPLVPLSHPLANEFKQTPKSSEVTSNGCWGDRQGNADVISELRKYSCRTTPALPYCPATDGTQLMVEPKAPEGDATDTVKVVTADKVRLRELRRVRQIRYRQKKEKYAVSLADEITKLRNEIEQLSQRRRSALAAVSTKESCWSVVVEYYRLFQHGVGKSSEVQRSIQAAFLHETMASDILFNTEYGVNAILKRWICISQWFANFQVELRAVEKNSSGILVATTITTVTITKQTLQQAFPHLRSSDESTKLSPLAQKLVGRTLVMHGSAQFEWDCERCRIKSIRSQSNMMSPVLRLLGDLHTVSRVFRNALVTLNFQCRVLEVE
ncbi:hypothetical protein CCR75_005452 [Bremia lactucae]|uniref:BZIP domain-containing protein n=1 Tax=Bremia lactucae TaxID=4779 RepID=A0A976FNB0_BRELC|nr:hypothetical protein CCR75_005452 [Bremia lactucae]